MAPLAVVLVGGALPPVELPIVSVAVVAAAAGFVLVLVVGGSVAVVVAAAEADGLARAADVDEGGIGEAFRLQQPLLPP